MMKLTSFLYIATFPLAIAPVAPGWAQLTPDSSLGAESSVVTPVNQSTDRIDGGAVRGSNLFHSFGEFNVDVGRSVYFANPPAIQNILTRVTGGNQSNIMGTLGILGDANLFLINPAGIVFGRSARLDISGSFFATTGDGIKLGENGLFSATDLDPSKLLHVQPEALFHNALANHMARLNNRGNLAVGTGSTLVLHGGEVRNSGSLTAPGGTVMVLGERIGLLDDASIDVSSPTGGGNVFIGGFLQGRGNMRTAGRTYIGPDVTISADAASTGDGGNVIVWASEVTGFYGDISARGGLDGGDGGFVEVSGGEKLIFRGDVDTTAALGNPGTLLLDPRNIIIANGSPFMEVEDAESIAEDIFNGTSGEDVTLYESQLEGLSGDANVILQATNDITVADLEDNSLSLARGTGDITFIADADRDGAGDFSMEDQADTINTNGRNIAITGASLTLGNIDTSLSAPDGAGELLTTAAVVSTRPGERLENISGNLSTASDVDLYQIYLTGEGTFSATTIDGSNVDTQLFLFDRSGLGVYGNDDNREACNCAQSTLPAGDPLTPTAPGIYYLGINVYGVNPISESGEIMRGNFDSVLEPTGAGGALPLVGWENVLGSDLGDYTITLTGVSGPSATFAEVIDNTVPSNSGAIGLTATNGKITAGNLNAASLSGGGGEIRIDAAGDIVLNEVIDTSGVSGNGGEVSLGAGGNITLNPGSGIITSGQLGGKIDLVSAADISIVEGTIDSRSGTTVAGTQGGDLRIEANRLSLSGNVVVATSGAGNGGNIYIDATSVEAIGPLEVGQPTSGLATSVIGEEATGNGGNLTIETERLTIGNGAGVLVTTLGAGNGGDLTVNATEVEVRGTSLSGSFSSLGSLTSEGNGGDLTICTERLTIGDGAQVFTNTIGPGKGGDLTVQALTDFDAAVVEAIGTSADGQQSMLSADVGLDATGDGGNLTISTGSLTVRDGAWIDTSSLGSGKAGDLMVRSSEVSLSGTSADGFSVSSLLTLSDSTDGGNLTLLTDRLTIGDGAQVFTLTFGEGKGGDLTVQALTDFDAAVVEAIGTSADGQQSMLSADVGPDATGDGGNLTISTGSVTVRDGAWISTNSLGAGKVGDLMVSASEAVSLSGTSADGSSVSRLRVFNASDSRGRGGDLTIESDRLTIGDGAMVSLDMLGLGKAGDLMLRSSEVSLSGTSADGSSISSLGVSNVGDSTGGGSNLTLESDRLTVSGGARLSSQAVGEANVGDIIVRSREAVEVSGTSVDGQQESEISAEVNFLATGDGGSVLVETDRLTVRDGGQIVTNAEGPGNAGDITIIAPTAVELMGATNGSVDSGLFARATTGDGGNVLVETDRLTVCNGAEINTTTFGEGKAGDITAIAATVVEVSGTSADGQNQSKLSAVVGPDAIGDGGNVRIESDRLFVRNGAQINTMTFGEGKAGDITAIATTAVDVSGTSADEQWTSSLFTSVGPDATGDGGDVRIETERLSVRDGAQINASTFGEGKAGDITAIAATAVEVSGTSANGEWRSSLFANVKPDATGDGGEVRIETERLTVSDGALINTGTWGSGKAGDITAIAATVVEVNGTSADGEWRSSLSANVGPDATGDGDEVRIETGRLFVRDGAQISVRTFGSGDAGDLIVTARENVEVSGTSADGEWRSSLFADGGLDATGDGGEVRIETGRLFVRDGGQISARAFGSGDAGDLIVTARENVEVSGTSADGKWRSSLFADVILDATGDGGEVRIETERLFVSDGGSIDASTLGSGNAGNISVTAREEVKLIGQSTGGWVSALSTAVLPPATGKGGSVRIETGRLLVQDGARISTSTFSSGKAGNLTVTAGEVELTGSAFDGLSVGGLFTQVNSEATGDGGDLKIEAERLTVRDGAQISASTFGSGNAGDLIVTASEQVELIGIVNTFPSGLFAVSEGRGEAGFLRINTEQLFVGELAEVAVRSTGDVQAGNLEVTATNVFLDDGLLGAQNESGANGKIDLDIADSLSLQNNSLITATTDSGIGGQLNIDVASEVTLDSNSKIASEATATGTAGSISIATNQLRVTGGSDVTVSSEEGIAGSLNLRADDIQLNNGSLSAETASGDQGNITIDAPTVVLRNNSEITTNATGTATGGNITISTENLVARDDSDISANAIDGRGGNISITASGVFTDNESEITATSERGVDGIVEIQTQEDPARGLISLAETPVDASSLISKGCEEYRGSEFIITGRGGIPPHPFEMLPGKVIWLDWRYLLEENSETGHSAPANQETSESDSGVTELAGDEIRQVQGWVRLPDGTVVLTAYPVKMTPVGPVMQHPTCQIILGDREQ
ncbi:MAG: filamentous hemagglutinin N-terminal domain-containing protein [Hormoscilla sp.]